MAGEDASLKLQIELEQTGNGGTTAAAELDGVKAAAGGAKGATGELSQETQKASTAAEEHTGKYRAQFLLFSEMNRIVPGLGHAIHAAFAGPIGPVILLTAAISEGYSKLKEFNKELDETGRAAASADFLEDITAQLKVFGDAAASAQAFADNINHVGDSEDTLSSKLKSQLDLYKQIERAQATLTSAQKELEIARIQEAEAGGKMTPEQAAEARAGVEKKYLDKQQQDHEAAQDQDLAAKQKAAAEAEAQQDALDKKYFEALQKRAALESHNESVKVSPEAQLEKIDKAGVAVDKAQEKYDRKKIVAAHNLPGSYAEKDLNEAGSELEKAKAQSAALKKQLRQYQATQTPEARVKLQGLKDAEDEAKRAAEKNKQFSEQQRQEIKAEATAENYTRPIEQQATTTKKQVVDAQESGRVDTQVKKDIETIQRAASSAHPSAEIADAAIQALADIKAGFKNYHGAVVGKMRELHTDINELTREVDTLRSQHSSARSTQTGG